MLRKRTFTREMSRNTTHERLRDHRIFGEARFQSERNKNARIAIGTGYWLADGSRPEATGDTVTLLTCDRLMRDWQLRRLEVDKPAGRRREKIKGNTKIHSKWTITRHDKTLKLPTSDNERSDASTVSLNHARMLFFAIFVFS